jgi:hypothetical protein
MQTAGQRLVQTGDEDGGSHWLIDSGDSLMLLLADLLLLLLDGELSLVVVLVLSAGRRLLVMVLEAVGGLRLVGLSRLGLLLAGLPLLLADLGCLGGRADEGLKVAALDGLLAVSRHQYDHSLALTGEQLCDDGRQLDDDSVKIINI